MVTLERLKELLSYDPDTGLFTWRVARGKAARGSVAGYLRPDGYLEIRLDERAYYAHRLAWLYTKGVWPPRKLDHEDLNKANNREGNLRLATNSQNSGNTGLNSRNTSGYKGVKQLPNGRFVAQIGRHGRMYHLGMYANAFEAVAAYEAAAVEHYGEFARVSW